MKTIFMFVCAIALAIAGVILARYAEADDAPGGVVLGGALVVGALAVGVKAVRQRNV